ncbi:3-coathanger stack domain-containing protein [Runella sp.]|uniref:3-coathanger stack domain-containing protein n=1 Tax=Runella sp. TaxID=1960881 RepID=UPI003D0B2D1F
MPAESSIQSSPTTINSTQKLTTESHVYYFAPQNIVLSPGFSSDNSGVFKAEIKDRSCIVR